MKDNFIFIDSNIVVYAYDQTNKAKHEIIKRELAALWDRDILPFISIQVLQECYVTFLKKGISLQSAREIIQLHLEWNVVDNDSNLLMSAIALKEGYHISFWDALIIAAAKRAQARVIWSEDFNPHQEYDGIRVINPFLEAPKL